MTLRQLLVSAVTISLAGLAGCALNSGSGLPAAGARDALYGVVDTTQTALGGVWNVQDDPTPRRCTISLWQQGVRYPVLRIGPPPRNSRLAINDVTTMWKRLGYSLTLTDVGAVTEVQARSPLNELLIFRVSADAMTLQGESECRPAA